MASAFPPRRETMILHVLIAMVAGWINRHQQQVIAYLQEEHRVLKAQHGGRRLRLPDTERRRLAVLAYPLGRQRLKELAILATPDTLLPGPFSFRIGGCTPGPERVKGFCPTWGLACPARLA